MTPLYFIVGLIAIQRLAELALSAYNTSRLKALGAVEKGSRHYPLFILLHGSWVLAILYFTPAHTSPDPWFLGLVILMQLVRIWVIRSLGRFWTTRIITLPGMPLVKKGPYRYLRHPNYLIVIIEIAALPLAFHDTWIALISSAANGGLLYWRIKVENIALAERLALASNP